MVRNKKESQKEVRMTMQDARVVGTIMHVTAIGGGRWTQSMDDMYGPSGPRVSG